MPDTETLTALVAEIEGLLAGLLPGGAAALLPPAADAEIRRVEARTGRPWPEDLRQLYRLHDGENGGAVFGTLLGLPFIPLAELERHWEGWDKIARDGGMTDVDEDCVSIPPDRIQEVYANSGWIPIGHDGGGNHLGVDLDPGPDGVSGQVINFGRDEETKHVIAPDLATFFAAIRDALRDGRFRADPDEDEDECVYFRLTDGDGKYFAELLLTDLPRLDLPFGTPPQTPPTTDLGPPFRAWLQGLTPAWQAALVPHVRGDETGYADLRRVTRLNLMRADIADAGPVARLTGLRELNLGGTGVTDLSPLAACPLLKTLYLSKSPVTDLSPLAGLSQLTQLSLYGTPVTDLRPLSALPGLRSLGLERTALPDLEQLALLPRLTGLQLGGNTFPSFAPLRHLRQLTRLDISETNLPDLSDVASLTRLTHLRAFDNPAQDWETLRPLTRLREIAVPFDAFQRLRAIFPQRLGVTVVGEMTEAEEEIFYKYTMENG